MEARPATRVGSTSGPHSTTACPSTSIPRRPARPVSWVYSPGVMSACVSPLNFVSRSSITVRAGMLMPSANVSVAKDGPTQAADEQVLDRLLERGDETGMVRGHPAAQPVAPVPVAEHVEVLCRDGSGALVDDGLDGGALVLGGQPEPVLHALFDGGVAAGPAEDEGNQR